ncbi:1784_t:CDS:2 [Gigaspora margarita]|uniref:1784_t:CDS:1 n=1 Tax=Gigaspora margarita TaxID=4874 RepID=A0ABM8W2Y9_GIGMA|nr:1784_t:CDS:2 [Gigaspora margarita]
MEWHYHIDLNIDVRKEVQKLLKFKSKTFLPLKQLITNANRNKKHPNQDKTGYQPRAQNGFVLWRKDLNAFLKNSRKSIREVSQLACKLWKGESPVSTYEKWKIDEIKLLYRKVSDIAKKVHNYNYPSYKYSPKRKNPKRKNLKFYKISTMHCYEPQSYYPHHYNFYSANIQQQERVSSSWNVLTPISNPYSYLSNIQQNDRQSVENYVLI